MNIDQWLAYDVIEIFYTKKNLRDRANIGKQKKDA